MLYFPSANADREADPNSSVKGLLSKIIYPTGGADTIVYEGNTVNEPVEVLPPLTDFNTTADSQDYPVSSTTVTQTANLSFDQDVVLTGSCEFYGSAGEDDPIHNKAIVYLYDNSTVVYQVTLLPGQSIPVNDYTMFTFKAGHSYYIKIVAGGTKVRGYASFDVRIGNKSYYNANVVVGGLRVAKVITRNAFNNADIIKKYYYAPLNNLSISSGTVMYEPQYIKSHSITTPCPTLPSCMYSICKYLAAFSSSQTSLFSFSSQPVAYKYVTESFGENFENGGIQHQYTVQADVPGQVYLNDAIIGAPLSNLGYSNGREIQTYVFKKDGDGFLPVKITYNHYKDDPRYAGEYSSYIINRKGNPTCNFDPPSPRETDIFDVYKYSIFSNWSYVDTTRTLVYGNDGLSYTEQIVVTEYANSDHCMPTKIKTNESDLRQSITTNYYPQDLTLTGDEETARQALVSRHIISPVLKSQAFKDNDQVTTTTINYKVFGNGVVAPYEVYLQTYQNTPEKRNQFPKYNLYGQLIQQSKPNDIKLNYLWDYNSMYPVAIVSNADSSDIAYAGFEADGSGNWNISNSTRNSGGFTGNNSYQLANGGITKTGLTPATNYIVSYWSTNGTPFTISGTQGTVFQGKKIGAWTYFEHKVTGVSQVALPQIQGLIDELRLYPANAQMTTYTYAPLIGITSTCSPNNTVIYYEYDGLGRLQLVKDQDGNVLKSYEYHYSSGGN